MDPNFDGIPGSYNVNQHNDLPNSNQLPSVTEDVYELVKYFSDDVSAITAVPQNEPNFGSILSPPADRIGMVAEPEVGVGAGEESLVPSWMVNSDEPSLYLPTAMVGFATDSNFEEDDFSETVKHITQILMEENMEERRSMFYDPLSLQVTEKSFYDALGSSYPLSPDQHPLVYFSDKVESPDGNVSGTSSDSGNISYETSTDLGNISNGTSNTNTGYSCNPSNSGISSSTEPPLPVNAYDNTLIVSDSPFLGGLSSQSNTQLTSQNFNQPPSTTANKVGVLDSSASELLVQNMFCDQESVLQFKRGLEEASKFLPKNDKLTTGLDSNTLSSALTGEAKARKEGATVKDDIAKELIKGRKNHVLEGSDVEEGRSRKQCAIYVEEAELSELFDKVLLDTGPPMCAVNQDTQERSSKASLPMKQLNASDGWTTRSKKQVRKKETVDLSNLLLLCAQAVSGNDSRTASELLKQIRHHASPLGDGSQRLAHFFANGLEARLTGNGNGVQIYYKSLASSRISVIEKLKAYKVLVSSCPFKKFAIFFANKMIMKAVEHNDRLHIIDFGIGFGFQWPILIKLLSNRPGGPPKVRITGIELPQTGFRPKERIEETGRRLAMYCKRFNVPFEFNAIASQRWETIQIEELKIDSRELLAVNCMFRFKNLLDDTVEVDCPRNGVLSLIRKMNPKIFVQNIMNGAYNAPFFFSRFKEALFHFSALFDMFDAIIPRENEYRLMFEGEFYGREVMNAIACEGLERVERPETYKQWQARLTRCGFRQLPLDDEIIGKFRGKLKEWYHRDFVIDADCNWMLQGWKGRIVYASSCWLPA